MLRQFDRTFLSLCFAAAACLPNPVFAQPASPSGDAASPAGPDARTRARALVVEGARQVRRGDYVKALRFFKQAYAVYPSPKILFNLAQTYRELGRPVDALNAYERFTREAPKGVSKDLLDTARKGVARLKQEVATILIAVNVPGARIRIDGKEVGLSPMDIPHRTTAGAHLAVVSKKGFRTATVRLNVKNGQRLVRKVALSKFKPRVVVHKVVYKVRRKPRKGVTLFWSGVGVTAALLAGVAVTGSLALYEQRVLEDENRSVARRTKAADRGKILQWVTNGLIIGAAASAAFTTVWGLVVVRRSGGTERIPVRTSAIKILPTGTGVLLHGRF